MYVCVFVEFLSSHSISSWNGIHFASVSIVRVWRKQSYLNLFPSLWLKICLSPSFQRRMAMAEILPPFLLPISYTLIVISFSLPKIIEIFSAFNYIQDTCIYVYNFCATVAEDGTCSPAVHERIFMRSGWARGDDGARKCAKGRDDNWVHICFQITSQIRCNFNRQMRNRIRRKSCQNLR